MAESIYQTLARIGYTHPLHPTITHVVIGLVIGGFLFGLVGLLVRRSSLAQSAHHCIVLALISLFPTVLLGYTDWQHRFGGAFLLLIKTKLALAGVLLVFLVIGIILRREPKIVVSIYALCVLTVIALGYFGGELVYGEKAQRPQNQEEIVSEGALLFNEKCSLCHYPDRTENKIGPGLKGLFEHEKLPVSGRAATEDSLRQQLKTPFGKMPPFGQLSEEEVKSLIAYLKTL